MHRALHYLFKNRSGIVLSYQYVQLYNQNFLDLLDTMNTRVLKVEEGQEYMVVKGAKVETATDADSMLARIAKGAGFRASGKTNMNDASSRSHAILIVMVPREGAEAEGAEVGGAEGKDDVTSAKEKKTKKGLKKLKAAKQATAKAEKQAMVQETTPSTAMYLVDLAGSERNKRSRATGQAFVEARSINTALSALGRVVSSLVEMDGNRAAHIRWVLFLMCVCM
jgi:hypothetical protein